MLRKRTARKAIKPPVHQSHSAVIILLQAVPHATELKILEEAWQSDIDLFGPVLATIT